MMTEHFRYPTPEEIRALERAARRARAEAIARLISGAVRSFARSIGRAAALFSGKSRGANARVRRAV